MEQKEERNFDYELESSFLEFGCGIRMGIVDVNVDVTEILRFALNDKDV